MRLPNGLLHSIGVVCLWGAALALGTVQAEPSEPKEGQTISGQQMQELQEIQQQMRAVGQQLGQIQQQALQANPKLQEQQREYRTLLLSTMKGNGHEPEADIARLGEIEGKLKREGVPEEERRQLIAEYRQTSAGLQQARQEAMQDEAVRAAAGELSEAVLTAMKAQDPKTSDLVGRMQALRERARRIVTEGSAPAKPDPSAEGG